MVAQKIWRASAAVPKLVVGSDDQEALVEVSSDHCLQKPKIVERAEPDCTVRAYAFGKCRCRNRAPVTRLGRAGAKNMHLQSIIAAGYDNPESPAGLPVEIDPCARNRRKINRVPDFGCAVMQVHCSGIALNVHRCDQ